MMRAALIQVWHAYICVCTAMSTARVCIYMYIHIYTYTCIYIYTYIFYGGVRHCGCKGHGHCFSPGALFQPSRKALGPFVSTHARPRGFTSAPLKGKDVASVLALMSMCLFCIFLKYIVFCPSGFCCFVCFFFIKKHVFIMF
jgi:hypothetical protein